MPVRCAHGNRAGMHRFGRDDGCRRAPPVPVCRGVFVGNGTSG